MPFYRKKPVVIEAVQHTKENLKAVLDFTMTNPDIELRDYNRIVCIKTLEGVMEANLGDWIIKGEKGEFYPCKPDIFDATYVRVGDPKENDE